jgi:hypothetical protein
MPSNRAFVVVVMLFVLTAVGRPVAESDTAVRIVPFQAAPQPYVVIAVPIKGRGCAPLVFDTGTNLSILAPELARALDFEPTRAIEVASASGRAQASIGAISGVGFARNGPTAVVAADLAALRNLAGNVSGIFGQSLLGTEDYLIDYEARRIVFADAGRLAARLSGPSSPLEWSEGRPAIVVSISAAPGPEMRVRLVLDSGVDRVTLFGDAARRLAAAARAVTTVRVEGPLGTTTAASTRVALSAGHDRRKVTATLLVDERGRQEDGLLPTSIFQSVLISASAGIVQLDPELRTAVVAVTSGDDCTTN